MNFKYITLLSLPLLLTVYLYKYKNKKLFNYQYKTIYSINILDNYYHTSNNILYKYIVDMPIFNNLENQYKTCLFGNYKTKQHIDFSINDLILKHNILEKYLIINSDGSFFIKKC